METLKQKLLSLSLVIDNEFLEKYVNLINNNYNTQKIPYKTQVHHIIPKYYFELNNLDIDNSAENTINLLYKDHILAHYYLALCAATKDFRIKNECALVFMSGVKLYDDFRLEDLDLYTTLREEFCKNQSNKLIGSKWSQDTINKRTISRSGYKHSNETKEKIRSANLGKKHNVSDDGRRRLSESRLNKPGPNKGKKFTEQHITNLSKAQKRRCALGIGTWIGKTHTDESKQKMRNSHLGKAWVTNGLIRKSISITELQDYLDKGWRHGYKLDK